jgi:sigma-B regulation protein RsbU (phosphoserine phosphatase)
VTLDAHAELFVFSDGVYELERPGSTPLPWPEFLSAVSTAAARGGRVTDVLLRFARDVSGSPEFADDFTLVHLVFR